MEEVDKEISEMKLLPCLSTLKAAACYAWHWHNIKPECRYCSSLPCWALNGEAGNGLTVKILVRLDQIPSHEKQLALDRYGTSNESSIRANEIVPSVLTPLARYPT